MRMTSTFVAILGIALGPACAYHPRPFVLQAGQADRESMIGTWRGDYSVPNGRHGLIDFTLAAGDDQAYGDVLMIADDARQPYLRYPGRGGPDAGAALGARSQVLTIRFVRAAHRQLTGAMTSYWDPDRRCEATATFYGTISRSTMEGTFVSLCDNGVQAFRGRWKVTRDR